MTAPEPYRVTTLCKDCDYTTVINRETDETREAFFERREDEAKRLLDHVRATHRPNLTTGVVGRRDVFRKRPDVGRAQ